MFPLRSILFLKSKDPRVLFIMEWDWEMNRAVNYKLINFSRCYRYDDVLRDMIIYMHDKLFNYFYYF